MLGIDRAGASHLCLLVLCLLWGRGDTAWPVSRDLLDDSNLSVVKGSGSLASKQFMGDYTKNLTQAASPVYGPVQYTYDAVGDTQGEENFIAQTYDFVVADMPLTQAQLKTCNRPIVQIPWAVNALGAAHSLPGVPTGALRLDAAAMAGIFQCTITQWNDPHLLALNSNITLPNVTINAVARIDRASGNYMMSAYLNASNVGWKLGVSKGLNWPSCIHRVKGAPDILAYLNTNPYSAGILQHVLLEDQKIPYARVQNRAGNYVMPGQANSADIGSDITFPTSVLSPDWVTVIIGFSKNPNTYPFSGLEYFVMNQNSRYMGYPESMLLREMAFGLLNASVQASVSAYRFSSLPHALLALQSQANVVAINRNENDTDPTPGGPSASPSGTAAAGGPRFKWWMGLIIALVAVLLLSAAVLAALLFRRRRRQKQVDQNKTMLEMNGNGHAMPMKPPSNGSGAPHSGGDGSDPRASSSGGTSAGQLQALALLSGNGPLSSNGALGSQRGGSLRSLSGTSLPSGGPSSRGLGTGGTGTGTGGGLSGPGGTPGTRGSGRESSLMSMRDLLRARSEAPLEALELGPLIGRGSFGRVYKGRWRAGSVAVKIINHDKHVGNNFDAMRESVLCSNINHPNVVMTYKVHTILQSQTESLHNSMGMVREAIQSAPSPANLGTASDSMSLERDCSDQLLETWMLLEYCDQGNLESAARESRFKNDFAIIYLCLMDIASGMDYLHSLGVLHGDVKGANVLLKTTAPTSYDKRGFVCKMADFGLSRVLEANATHVSTFTYGTAAYMAPELLQKGKMTRAADVYSFAMIMVELFTCKRLFEGLAQQQIMYQVFSGQKPPVNRKEMPGPYGQLIDDCWQEDPEERPTFAAILQRLRGMYKDERQRLHDLQLAAGEAPATLGSQPSSRGPAPAPSNSTLQRQGDQAHVYQQQQQQQPPLLHQQTGYGQALQRG
ncbi:hypothetical protein CVIRNUC_000587 [Coccomyxa viridis]|uniref:Protein kinase domain-containing protein n=1 Tax=Coccomyxa viridis TaxID=1274662 RepID=A0AAV1HTJ3_9CHLO|nr:hypothetical protein CVIRNUC_000587 [Coccomyxa viridis]